MKIALYVHDLRLEIGHSNSLIELIRHLPPEFMATITEIRVVTFTTTPLEVLFPEFTGKLTWVRVPLADLRPVLLKSLFYQLWTWGYNCLFARSFMKIGIGISSLAVDAVSIQFIHHQWTRQGLELESGHRLRKMYKRVLFSYFELCERFLMGKPGLKFFSPANFLTEFLQKKRPGIDATTIYSGVNLSRFEIATTEKGQVLAELKARYPVLSALDVKKPVYLFVGAYERKGLPEALDRLSRLGGESQLIVVGSPSQGRSVKWPTGIKVFGVPFTKEIPKFYALADVFIFPTLYEPFGLVLFEAMAMGLVIITRRSQVGASELLGSLPEVYFCDADNFRFPDPRVLDTGDKRRLRDERLSKLGDVSWHKAGGELARLLSRQ